MSSSAAAAGDKGAGSASNHASANAPPAVTRSFGSNTIIRYIRSVAAPERSELSGTTSDLGAGSKTSKEIFP